jgi:hypothetical protein
LAIKPRGFVSEFVERVYTTGRKSFTKKGPICDSTPATFSSY